MFRCETITQSLQFDKTKMKEKTWVEGEIMLKQCPDGFIIVIAEQIDNKWRYTNVRCLE